MHANSVVSVIVPCHNRIDYLRECLESVASQSYPSIELLISDDGSTVDTIPRVLESINWNENIKVNYIRSVANRGPGHARELGRKCASGDYIAYLDSDDIWHLDFLRSQVKNLATHSWAGMSYCVIRRFASTPLTGQEQILERSTSSHGRFFPQMLAGRPWGTSACLWNRKAMKKIGPWPLTRSCEDFAYDWRAGCLDIQLIHNPEPLCYVRRGAHFEHITGLSRLDLMELNLPSFQNMVETAFETNRISDSFLRKWLVGLFYKYAFEFETNDRNTAATFCFQIAKDIRSKFEWPCFNNKHNNATG